MNQKGIFSNMPAREDGCLVVTRTGVKHILCAFPFSLPLSLTPRVTLAGILFFNLSGPTDMIHASSPGVRPYHQTSSNVVGAAVASS